MYRIQFKNVIDLKIESFDFASREDCSVFEELNGDCWLILPQDKTFFKYPGVRFRRISPEIYVIFTNWLEGSEYSEYSCYKGSGKLRKIG